MGVGVEGVRFQGIEMDKDSLERTRPMLDSLLDDLLDESIGNGTFVVDAVNCATRFDCVEEDLDLGVWERHGC